jgi:thioredoxin 2
MSDRVHAVCPHCGAVNRIPVAASSSQLKCGSCSQPLFTGHPVELAGDTFEKHLTRNDIPLLVDFWASWCAPCKMMAPQFAQAATQLEPKIRLAKVNTETEQMLAARYTIQSIPTLVLFHHGREIARQPGVMRGAEIIRWVQSHM